MICIRNPQLDDVELLMALDGEAGAEVTMHLSQCPQCQLRAAELAAEQRRITQQLWRAACPPALELGEHSMGLLSADRSAAIQQHIAACPYCTQELAQLAHFMDSPDPYLHPAPLETLQRRVNVLVARLTSASQQVAGLFGAPTLTPSLAGLRGADGEPLTYEAGDLEIILEVQDHGGQPGNKTLAGLVVGMDDASMTAHLWHIRGSVASTGVDELGNFLFQDLEAGRYELILASGPDEVHIQDLLI